MAEDLQNEIGTAPPRGRPLVPTDEANQMLSDLTGGDVRLTDNVLVHGAPTSCPVCESPDLMWGCDERQGRPREQVHPLIWDAEAWMADSFICRACWAGWIETDAAEAITWVRPYWRVSA